MKERIAVIICLSLALPLLFGGFHVYAEESGPWGRGDIIPSLVYIGVNGDKDQFAEDRWIPRNVTAGISDYSYINENKNGDSIVAEGRGLIGNGDYLFNFDLKKEGFGNLIFEFKQFNKYYDGSGGFFSLFRPTSNACPNTYSATERDLFLDIGNLKVETIFSKEEGTECAFSYEREYRKGTKSLISWGAVTGNSYTRNILPTFLETDEIVDKLDLKIEHTAYGINISAEQTWESARIKIQKVNNRTLTLTTGAFSNIRYKYEDLDSDLYTTVIRASKDFNEKVFLSLAFLCEYSRGHTKEKVTDTSVSAFNENHPLNPANIFQTRVTVLPKVYIPLLEHLFADAGFRWEWVGKNSAGTYNRDKKNPPDYIPGERLNIMDKQRENKLGETFSLKFDGVRDVVLYGEGELGQEIRDEDNTQDSFGDSPTAGNNFMRNTKTNTYDYAYTIGAKSYPMPKVDVTTEFKYKYGYRNYHSKEHAILTGDVTNGYRGFLDSLSFTTYSPIVMFNFKPLRWLACNVRYSYDSTTYGIKTRVADAIELAGYNANNYSTGLTLTPNDTLYLTFYYQYKEASTETPANGTGGGPVNQPTYNANVKTLNASCSYSPFKNTTITGSYSFSLADNFNDFSNTGLPLGLDNFSQDAFIELEKKITKDLSLGFKYDLMQYDETSNNGIDDYIAHLFYTALKAKF
ncbi:MAG: hypothetical protein Q8N91_01485 [Candidatus Omnitrophota bacterium]|nr:hypothetical protein [Candidatus Omnitrophota bacterium]